MLDVPSVLALFLSISTSSAPATDEGKVTTAPGVVISYERIGNGPHAILVPNRLYMPEFRALARKDRSVVLYDMRNRGDSGRVDDPALLTLAGDVDDMEALRAHFGFERVSLVGYSYLGLAVARYAARHPDRVHRFVQIGAVPRQFGTDYPGDQVGSADTLDAAGQAARAAWLARWTPDRKAGDDRDACELFAKYLSYLLVGNPANAARVPNTCRYPNERPHAQERHLVAHFGDVQKQRFPKSEFVALRHPVLTVHGTWDRNAPYGAGLEWATTFPNARLITVDQGAHQVWLDDPSVLNEVDSFLDGKWPPRAQRFGRE